MSIRPIVTVLSVGGLATMTITKCDWCGESLLRHDGSFKWETVQIEDDAVRPMYFCGQACRRQFNERYSKSAGAWPAIKLRVDGNAWPLKGMK